MPHRIPSHSTAIASFVRRQRSLKTRQQYTTTATIASAASYDQITKASYPIERYPPTQPPSYKPPEFRKSQLLRQYASLVRSTPLMLLFQHNNLKSNEWSGIRRELNDELKKVDEARVAAGFPREQWASKIKIQVIQTGIFSSALKIVDFYKPEPQTSLQDPTEPVTLSSATIPIIDAEGANLTHTLSKSAHDAVAKKKHPLGPLLSGPLAVLTFPDVSPQHLKAALTIISPNQPNFPAPKKRTHPGWHDPLVQSGITKLLLLGARVEGKVFDIDKTKWIGGIEGGLEGLRAQLIILLQGVGAGVTRTLESTGRSLYFTVEGRRIMQENKEVDLLAK